MDTDDQPSTSPSLENAFKALKFVDILISEVKKRPILWDFKHVHHGNRKKLAKEWEAIASIVNKGVEEVKAKWRNLKDTFYREEKKIELPLVDEGKPLMSYYTGQWANFEKLLFLCNTRRHTRSNEEYVEPEVPEICIEDIKGEIDSDHTNESYVVNPIEVPVVDESNMFPEATMVLQTVLNTGVSQNISGRRKRAQDDDGEIDKKRRTLDHLPIVTDTDEDMLVKSLVPFLRKLNPIKKLIVRNELQNLLIKEMLCDQCRSFGLQPNCRCNS